jgi:outer membrane protein assembly factor BamB
MAVIGTGDFTYEVSGDNWGHLPDGWSYQEATAVAVDSKDNVYVFNRGEHPVIVLDKSGNFVRSWGEGVHTSAHGVNVGPDDSIYCVDAGDHSLRKYSPEGELLMTIGQPGTPAERDSGAPFRNPTHSAVNVDTSDIYISDGYSNARVHKYDADGEHLLSWGRSGTEPGEFNTVHNIAVDRSGMVYVADRENQRIQVFDPDGNFVSQWKDLAKTSCIAIVSQGGTELAYVGEMYAGLPDNPMGWGNWVAKRLGPRVSVLDLRGEIVARVGDARSGLDAGQFIAPHGISVDSQGHIYLAEVSYSAYGSRQTPPREVRSLQRLDPTG